MSSQYLPLSAFRQELENKQLKLIRFEIIYLWVSWLITLIIKLKRKEIYDTPEEYRRQLIIRGSFQVIIFIGLLLTRFWKLEVVKPLSLIVLVRIYIWMFQVTKIFEKKDRLLQLFGGMIIAILTVIIHVSFMGKIILKNRRKLCVTFYMINACVVLFGLVEKTIGFVEAYEIINTLRLSMLLMAVGLIFLAYLINEFQKNE